MTVIYIYIMQYKRSRIATNLSGVSMENFDRENIDELLEIRQICQYFPPSKICAVQYVILLMLHM